MISALHAIRAKNPELLICAVPVAPPDTIKKVARYADQVICLQTLADFQAVGQFYLDFSQVSDAEVVDVLRETAAGHG
jgi:predicted phosphoribosyltransferase